MALLAADVASARPTLRIGTSGDYAPFSRDGRGFDVDVAQALGRALGYEIVWRRFSWPGLEGAVRQGRFDIAMSGVTWRPARAVVGSLSRAVASGGPCVLGVEPVGKVGVNRGGILERYARDRFGDDRVVTVDDNTMLPTLLTHRRVGAIVTDTFELRHFARPGWAHGCEPPRDRKVYWITPSAPKDLRRRVDAFLRESEPLLGRLRQRWFGDRAPRTDADHIVDLIARRLAMMPAVAAIKRAQGKPIEDLARERVVLDKTTARAEALGIGGPEVQALFELQIELAKAVQRRAPPSPPVASLTEIRRVLLDVGDRILEELALAPSWPRLEPAMLAPLSGVLAPDEVGRLAAALSDVQRAALRRGAE